MNIRSLFSRVSTAVLASLTGLVWSLSATAAERPNAFISHTQAHVQRVMTVQRSVTRQLMSLPEVLGTAVGQADDGEVSLVVFVNSNSLNHAEVMKSMPTRLNGERVVLHPTEPFRAMGKPAKRSTVSHVGRQLPPIKLGTSGGWDYDLANGYCCGGTLGSLVQIGGLQYILSNYHVFESDIVLGGNNRVKNNGDPVIQPGLIDVGCSAAQAQSVATLVVRNSLPVSNVDAAIAEVVPGMVDPAGAILEIGTISARTTPAGLNQAVKKSGRTTGLTRSKVVGLNATVSVTYDNECAGGTAFTKTFTGQIVVSNSRSTFLNSGDSGSLLVEDLTTNPRAIGLLFAGSNTSAIANPIDEVLGFLGATMVGK